MISVELKEIAKRFNQSWIIKHATFTINQNEIIALTGSNGSGKSTLLKIISSALSPSQGNIKFFLGSDLVKEYELFRYLSYCAPYLNLIEELTVSESIEFHSKFKNFRGNITPELVLQQSLLSDHSNKYVKDLSSGMQQRLKLTLAILTESTLLLLDEPTSYLDNKSKSWYHEMLRENLSGRTVIIASNDQEDLSICQRVFNVEEFK